MKKHRNFLIFYTFWLGTIILILTIFNTPQDSISVLKNDGAAVCASQTTRKTFTEPAKNNANRYCVSKQHEGVSTLQ